MPSAEWIRVPTFSLQSSFCAFPLHHSILCFQSLANSSISRISPNSFPLRGLRILLEKYRGTPLHTRFRNLKRITAALARNLELIIVNCRLPFPSTALFPPLTNCLPVSPLLATLTKNEGLRVGVSQRAACARTQLRFSHAPRSATHSTSATIFVLPYLPWGQYAR